MCIIVSKSVNNVQSACCNKLRLIRDTTYSCIRLCHSSLALPVLLLMLCRPGSCYRGQVDTTLLPILCCSVLMLLRSSERPSNSGDACYSNGRGATGTRDQQLTPEAEEPLRRFQQGPYASERASQNNSPLYIYVTQCLGQRNKL